MICLHNNSREFKLYNQNDAHIIRGFGNVRVYYISTDEMWNFAVIKSINAVNYLRITTDVKVHTTDTIKSVFILL